MCLKAPSRTWQSNWPKSAHRNASKMYSASAGLKRKCVDTSVPAENDGMEAKRVKVDVEQEGGNVEEKGV